MSDAPPGRSDSTHHGINGDAGIDRLHFAVDPEADPTAFDKYHALYALGSDVSRIESRFRADVRCLRLDRLMIHDRRVRALSHGRSHDQIRRNDLSHFTVTLCLEGKMFGACEQGFRRIRPGEVWLSDVSRPAQTRIEDARLLTVGIGPELVEAITDSPRDLNATILSARHSAPLARSLLGFIARQDDLSPEEAADAARSVSDIIGTMLGAPNPSNLRRLDRMANARRLIDACIDDPMLDADLIAAGLGL